MTQFLNEVAAELAERGIGNPTHEQIAEAMRCRVNRQAELWRRLFRTEDGKAVRSELAADVWSQAHE